MLGKHGCTGITSASAACSAFPLKDSEPPVCLAHADQETRERAGFGGAQPNSGRPKLPKPMDLARQLVEEHAAALLRPHFKSLGLLLNDDGTVLELPSGAVVVHQGEATDIEDLGAQIAAARELLDRVYGKPKQATEITGKDGTPLGPMFVTDPALAEDARALLRRAASASSDQPRGPGDSY